MNTRVLVIGAHPDDEDTFLIAWLSRGRHVETAYLSLTRGDGGQNLIGNELGDALGVIRTEELLAARRIDGAQQFFTRAYDFGFSKDTIDTYKHWQRDSILGDVVRVIRLFRPHVIVAVFSGTPRDGHGHHQVSGLLARTAYDISGDSARFPRAAYGGPWTALKFYRAARFNADAATLRFDAGEYSPLLGRSYAEIAGESRSQHKSQGFGAPQRKGQIFDHLRGEASRVNQATAIEATIFDGIDTTWARFRPTVSSARERSALDSLPSAFAAAQRSFDAFRPHLSVAPLARALRLVRLLCPDERRSDMRQLDCEGDATLDSSRRADLWESARIAERRLSRTIALAAAFDFDVTASREVYPARRISDAYVTVTQYNRGSDTIRVPGAHGGTTTLAPGAAVSDSGAVNTSEVSQPWWLATPRRGDMFVAGRSPAPEREWVRTYPIVAVVGHGADTATIVLWASVIYRFADPVKGQRQRLVAAAPAIAVTLDQQVQYAPANANLDRELEVHLRSADDKPRDVRVTLALPKGLTADSGMRTARLARYDAQQTVTFRIRGRLPVGEHRIDALAESDGETFTTGYDLIDYDHIRRQRIYRPATTTVSAVDVRVPPTLRVAYVAGVGDNVAPMLAQLGIPVTMIAASEVAKADLKSYTTVVVGPRAYEAHPELVAANARLLEFARKGGTLVVQYGQYEMAQPGIMPYPITLARPADRVTEEDSPVTIVAPIDPILRSPNRIGVPDFAGWIQERALYMPRTFDEHYSAPLSMNDTGEQPNRGAILVAPLGDGKYVYTTLSLFRQLPAGVPGGARLFVNLLSAGLASPRVNP